MSESFSLRRLDGWMDGWMQAEDVYARKASFIHSFIQKASYLSH